MSRTRTSELWPDDRELVSGILDDLILKGMTGSRELASAASCSLMDSRQSGDLSSERIIQALAADGLRSLASERLKAVTVSVSWSGQTISVPARLAVRDIDQATGKATGHYQYRLWYDLPWPQFDLAVDERAQQRDILGQQVAAFREVQRLRDRFPSSQTPGDALRSNGVEPDSLHLAM